MRFYKPAVLGKEKRNGKLAAKAAKFGGEMLNIIFKTPKILILNEFCRNQVNTIKNHYWGKLSQKVNCIFVYIHKTLRRCPIQNPLSKTCQPYVIFTRTKGVTTNPGHVTLIVTYCNVWEKAPRASQHAAPHVM